MSGTSVSSPAATGGAGTFFEQHVAAYWLAQLLVRGIPPILIDTNVVEVHFQTELHGWNTDDFLIVCEGPENVTRKLVGQVKRSFTLSASDDDCKSAVLDFWKDFQNPTLFSQSDDRMVLVTLRGTNTLLEHLAGLLDCARAARDATEFELRLGTEGFVSNKVVRYCGEFCEIIGDYENRALAAADIWPFLRLLHVLSLDLHTSTKQTEAQIKNLLSHTAIEGGASQTAEDTWNSLLALSSTAIPEAQRLRREDLPTELQRRHGSLGVNEQRILNALKDHTAPVLRSIRSTIGPDFHLGRTRLVQSVIGELETSQVVLVSGPAGSGKSAIGKDVVSILSQDHFVFGFRAEEFAQAHIDATLQAGQIPSNAETLAAILAAQGRKIILVESVERLLEKATRDAFSDLIALAAADQSMYLVLTCRDYSVELVRATLLQPAGVSPAIVDIPPLDDAELTEVEKALPELAHPLNSLVLRDILRNPYFLDKALEISWSEDRPLPDSEREFRLLFWQQIVRAGQGVSAGMARRREEVFQEIAVRRARALSAHVLCNDLDAAVVSALGQDSLVVSSDENLSLVSTAHDVLEDWAILQWLEEQHLTGDGAFKDLSAAIGGHPAIRRSYRKWIAELVGRDPGAADRLFKAAISETEISAQFRDDTLISLLKAPSSPEFLERHEVQLLANDKTILRRVIQLLRIACVVTPKWLAGYSGIGSALNVPDGPAWASVLRIVHKNIDRFTDHDRALLLGFVEDAVRGVSWKMPELDGAEFVAGISHWLLADLTDYSSDEMRKRVLKVIARIPKADATRFEAALRGTKTEESRRDRAAEDFQEIILCNMEGMHAARDLPELVMDVASEFLLVSEDELRRDGRYSSSLDIGKYFGIRDGFRRNFFPASAYRGPWIHLLRYHSRKAIDFFIHIFNYSADWYAHPRAHDPLEPAEEIELTFADGSVQKQWGNPRLWNLFRDTSVGPDALKSMLMALELWLIELASQSPEALETVQLDILRRSESAMLSAVVASSAIAYPKLSREALLVLLSAPAYITIDLGRAVSEFQASGISEMIPQLIPENKIYSEERKNANSLPHRRRSLEDAVVNIQMGEFASRVHEIFDRHLAALPPKAEQDESDMRWRLAIHRMDLRQYTVAESNDKVAHDVDMNADDSKKQYVVLEPKAPDADIQAMVDDAAAEYGAMSQRLRILMWGLEVFERKEGKYDPSDWSEMLAKARELERENQEDGPGKHAHGFVAAVCVRDHWDEMSTGDREWCTDIVCSEVLRSSESWDQIERMQRFSMAADRPCASVISLLLHKSLTDQETQLVRQAFAAAVTHPVEEVNWYATWAINGDFWVADPVVAMRCVNAIAMGATIVDPRTRNRAWTVI